jgi:hypothetical protein
MMMSLQLQVIKEIITLLHLVSIVLKQFVPHVELSLLGLNLPKQNHQQIYSTFWIQYFQPQIFDQIMSALTRLALCCEQLSIMGLGIYGRRQHGLLLTPITTSIIALLIISVASDATQLH